MASDQTSSEKVITTDSSPSAFGERWAQDYDDFYVESLEDTTQTVNVLASLAGIGPVAELGAGTGRVAIPLAQRGLKVRACDASAAMLRQLREKPGSDLVDTSVEVMPDLTGGPYSLVAILVNTLWALPELASQRQLFLNVSRALAPGGHFVVESGIPTARTYEPLRLITAGEGHLYLHERRFLPGAGILEIDEHIGLPSGISIRPLRLRPVTMGEMDLMGEIAGLERAHRWSSWSRSPLLDDSTRVISVYRRPHNNNNNNDNDNEIAIDLTDGRSAQQAVAPPS